MPIQVTDIGCIGCENMKALHDIMTVSWT